MNEMPVVDINSEISGRDQIGGRDETTVADVVGCFLLFVVLRIQY